MKKILYILFSLIFVINCSFAQKNKPSTPPELHKNAQKQSNNLVLSYPPNKYTERIYKKLQKTKLTKKEQLVLVKASLTNKPLTPFEKFIYLRAIRKIKKRKQILLKYIMDTTLFKLQSTANLTQAEKKILQLAKDSSFAPNPVQKAILNSANKKLKKLNKLKKKYTLSPEEKKLLEKEKIANDSIKLSLYDKIKLFFIHQKLKRIEKLKLIKGLNQGDWIPVKVHRPINLALKFKMRGKNKPSSFYRKLQHLAEKYKLSSAEQKALSDYKQNRFLTPKEKRLAYRAETKKWKFQHKFQKLNQKYFLSFQDHSTKKRIKSYRKHSKINMLKTNTVRFFNNIKDTLKRLLS